MIVPIVIVLFLGVGGYLIDRARAAQQSLLSGYFESQPTEAASRLGGRVTKILASEGDFVKAGQPLVRLEANSFVATLGASRMAASGARQQYVETAKGPRPEDIEKQEAAVREAQADYDKLVNGSRPEDIKQAKAKLAEAEAQYKKMREGSRPEEIASALAARNVALEKFRQAQRGMTTQQKLEFKARADEAVADAANAEIQRQRQKTLYEQGAIAKKDYDAAVAASDEAAGRMADARAALKDAEIGTPREELAQAQQGYRQAQAQYELVVRGNRPEDIEAARQEVFADVQALKLLVEGSRAEDIRSGKARLEEAQAALLELQHGNRQEDVERAKAAARQAQFQAQSTAETLKEDVVYATRDANVDRVLVAVGDLVQANGPVVQLGYPDDIWLRVYVPEDQLHKVKVGDRADIAVDGVAGVVAGVAESIASNGEYTPANLQSPEERGKQVFGVRIRLAKPDRRVKAGMYATVKRLGNWP